MEKIINEENVSCQKLKKIWEYVIIACGLIVAIMMLLQTIFGINWSQLSYQLNTREGGLMFAVSLLLLIVMVGEQVILTGSALVLSIISLFGKTGKEAIQEAAEEEGVNRFFVLIIVCLVPFGCLLPQQCYVQAWITAPRIIGFTLAGIVLLVNGFLEKRYFNQQNSTLRCALIGVALDAIRFVIILFATLAVTRICMYEEIMDGANLLLRWKGYKAGYPIIILFVLLHVVTMITPAVIFLVSHVELVPALYNHNNVKLTEYFSKKGKKSFLIIAACIAVTFLNIVLVNMYIMPIEGRVALWFDMARIYILPMFCLFIAAAIFTKAPPAEEIEISIAKRKSEKEDLINQNKQGA